MTAGVSPRGFQIIILQPEPIEGDEKMSTKREFFKNLSDFGSIIENLDESPVSSHQNHGGKY